MYTFSLLQISLGFGGIYFSLVCISSFCHFPCGISQYFLPLCSFLSIFFFLMEIFLQWNKLRVFYIQVPNNGICVC